MSNRNIPYTYEEVKEYIESFNYKLLSEEYINSNSHIIVKCPNLNHEPYKVTFSSFKNGSHRCPYCTGRLITKEKSIAILFPDIAKSIVEDKRNNLTYEDTYKISPHTHIKYYFKCFKCNKYSTRKKRVFDMIRYDCPCEYCSDGISIPEKFMANILNCLNVDFITQYTPDWISNRRYDFYIPSLNIIIETHGKQHYKDTTGSWMKLDEQLLNDEYKKKVAIENNICKYIVINCSHSTLDWLKQNIIKEIGNIFILENINWNEIWIKSQKSLVFTACELWNDGLCVSDIANKLKLSTATIRTYLKNGKILNICDYTIEKGSMRGKKKTSGKNNGSAKSVICLTTKEIFFTMKDAMKKYNIKSTGAIPACCKGYVMRKGKKEKIKSVGKTKDGKPLVWRYIIWNHGKKFRIKK